MGKNLLVIGALGLVKTSRRDNYQQGIFITEWRAFPVLEFPHLINIMGKGMKFEDDLNWYLLTAQWESDEYKYTPLVIERLEYEIIH